MRLNLRQIEVFRAIMLTGSISSAAQFLHVSQPAVSRLISYTEQRLRLVLFERIKGRLHPTPEARRLFVEVNAVYESLQRVDQLAGDLIESRLGSLRIACSPSLSQALIPRAVTRFQAQYPEVRINVSTMLPGPLMQSVLTQEVDLGIAFLIGSHPNLQSRKLFENAVVVALPAGHPLACRDVLSLADLEDEIFIGYDGDIPIGQFARELFQEEGSMPHVKIQVQQVHLACALVHAGAGIALVDELTASDSIWSNIVVRPVEPRVSLPVSTIQLTSEPLSRLAQQFVEMLKSLPQSV